MLSWRRGALVLHTARARRALNFATIGSAAPATTTTMLQIEPNNLLLHKTLTERVFPESGADAKSLDRIITDFDFTTFHVSTIGDNEHLLISVYLKCWDDLVQCGVVAYLNDKYGAFGPALTVLGAGDVEASYNYSMVLDLAALATQSAGAKAELVEAVLYLKRHAMASAFARAFARYDELAQQYAHQNTYAEEVQAQLAQEEVLTINYRGREEAIYIKPLFDRVTVVFLTIFQDETDKVFGRVFLQEFVDARKRSVQTAPQVLYSHREAPRDILGSVAAQGSDNKGYVTFVLFPRHLVQGDKRENCITHIQVFRNYFHYHIKCSKAYMHSRMRFRVREFLKILNRAKPENIEEGRERKTASGRRFAQA